MPDQNQPTPPLSPKNENALWQAVRQHKFMAVFIACMLVLVVEDLENKQPFYVFEKGGYNAPDLVIFKGNGSIIFCDYRRETYPTDELMRGLDEKLDADKAITTVTCRPAGTFK